MPDATTRDAAPPTTNARARSAARVAGLALALAAGGLVLFPFDWLEGVWPAYGRVFVFATAAAHLIGHAAIFFFAGALALLALPALRARPWAYLALMAPGALAEEGIQSLAKLQLPNYGDGRDLLMDLLGFAAAYLVVRAWSLARKARPAPERAAP